MSLGNLIVKYVYCILISLCFSCCNADVLGITGSIKFILNNDNQTKMNLNSTGLSVGHTNPSANLHVTGNTLLNGGVIINGAIDLGFQMVSSNTTLSSNGTMLVDTSSDNVTLTLPSSASFMGRQYIVKKTSRLNQLWIAGNDSIEGELVSLEMTKPSRGFSHLRLLSDGTQWVVLEKSSDVTPVVGSDNLVGWWKLDETSGTTAYDSSGRNHHGALNGGFTFSGNSENGVSGKFRGAVHFDGTDDYINVGDVSDLSFPNNTFTISCWFKADDTTSLIGLLGKRGSPWEYALHAIGVGGTIIAESWSSGGANVYNGVSMSYSTAWTHLVYTADGANASLYRDGVLIASTAKSVQTMSDTSSPFTIGLAGNGAGAKYMKGILDDIRVYNKALSADEILSLAESVE